MRPTIAYVVLAAAGLAAAQDKKQTPVEEFDITPESVELAERGKLEVIPGLASPALSFSPLLSLSRARACADTLFSCSLRQEMRESWWLICCRLVVHGRAEHL